MTANESFLNWQYRPRVLSVKVDFLDDFDRFFRTTVGVTSGRGRFGRTKKFDVV
jgi:hypothetical protein